MPINVNPINIASLAALAQKYAPDYNLKPAVNDMTQGLLGVAQLEAQQRMKEEELANAIMKAQYEQTQMNAREQLKSQTQLATNANTVSATLRGQDIVSSDKAADRTQRGEIEGAKLGLNQQQLALDAFYKTNDIDIKKQQAFETALNNEFNRKIKLDDVQREKEANIYGGVVAALQQAGDDPAAVEQVKKVLTAQLQDAGMLTGKDLVAINNMDSKSLYQTAASHLQIDKMASMVRAQDQAASETANKIKEVNKFRRANGLEELSKETQQQMLEKSLAASISGNKQVLSPGEQIQIEITKGVLAKEQESASLARDMIPKYDIIEKLSPKALSGKLAELELSGRQVIDAFGKMFGVNTEDKTLTASQAIDAMAKNLQLDYQTLLKGNTSDRDLSMVAKIVPQLANTAEGRVLIANIGKHQAIMKVQRADFLNEWSLAHQGSLSGSDEAWNKYINSRNDFDEKTMRFNNEGITSSSWKPFLDENYTPPVDLDAMAAKAVADGADPKVVQERLIQLKSGK